MNKQHTPGPWAWRNDTLCQATGNFLHLGKWIESPGLKGAGKGNKELIAAAPELLDALEKCVKLLREDGATTKLALAAIAKAKGGQA